MPIPIYTLSLIHARERRKAVSAEFAKHGLDFQFVDAIDGRRLADADVQLHYDQILNASNFKRPISREEIACALGHRAIWRKIAEGSAPVALVCEDDLLLSAAFGGLVRSLAIHETAFAHVMIKLDAEPRGGELIGSLAGVNLVLTRRIPGRTTAYFLGRFAAIALLKRAGKISRPIDMDLKHYWEHGISVLISRPQLAFVRQTAESSIQTPRAAMRPGPWRRTVKNLQYQWGVGLNRLRFPLHGDQAPELLAIRKLLSDAE